MEERYPATPLQIQVSVNFAVFSNDFVRTDEPFCDLYENWIRFSITAEWQLTGTVIRRCTWRVEMPQSLQYDDARFRESALPQLKHPVQKRDFPARVILIPKNEKPTVCFTQQAYDLFKKLSPLNV